ncbi:MAG: NAD-glutamate dehydrogenase [Rhodocyclaceae bacterium]|nr:NAD-glutamate dehydrogenase [Rhodocyclaceae bacterium]
MSPLAAAGSEDLFAQVLALIHDRMPAEKAALLEAFAHQYFRQVDPEDFVERQPADLYGALASHWHFIREHGGGTRIRAFNPRLDEHGWESTHTIIEIIGDDMPFLVDSVGMELNRQGLTLHLIVHPVMRVRRDDKGHYLGLAEAGDSDGASFESLIHVEVDRRTEPDHLAQIEAGLADVLADVRAAVRDWPKMRQRLSDIIAGVDAAPPPGDTDETAEALEFLQWLADDNFVLLGCRDYELVDQDGENELRVLPGTGLGLLRETGGTQFSASFAALPAEIRAQAHLPSLLTITKSNTRSTVHRSGYLDYVGVKTFDASGEVTGERRVIGLLTSTAYNTNPKRIPLLRRKVTAVIERAGLMPKSHAGKALVTILEQYPRDELFQASVEDLYHNAIGILRLGERQRIRLFVRPDTFCRFVTCLIYVPRENYNTEQRKRMQAALAEAYDGIASEFEVHFSESALARILIIVRLRQSGIPDVNVRELESRLVRVSRRWEDDLREALVEHLGEERGITLYHRYGSGFPAGYREEYPARMAVRDIEQMESLADGRPLAMNLYVPLEAEPGQLNFKLFRAGAPVPLSHSLPMLERMGVRVVDERPAEISRQDGTKFWVHDFGMTLAKPGEIQVERLRERFHEAFMQVWQGGVENDDFNRLTLLAGLSWREIRILRAYAKYMKQAAFTFSQTYMEQVLASYPAYAGQLVRLFCLRFDPTEDSDRNGRCDTLRDQMLGFLDTVANLDEDRILRQFLAMIDATLRTNFYQKGPDGDGKPYLSFKLNPARIPNLPEPRPMFEIFVYSPRIEGVHLRGGKVARGGLRWSDRMEDFRTEILGLVKAQIVKNAVIVPVGSKGGFVVKQPPAGNDREALLAEGVACYKTFLRGLLDLTDNLVRGEVIPPLDVVRHDGDDPYLVVAADKGTATFSDIANGISAEYGFWLGDAFASGGSVGYDHKKMGITARGAWESVKRHFRELGVNTQEEDFTVVGIGDMSGDVFGNGMLLSRHIRLLAAFDHRHVFIDPDPDSARSWEERDRLFALPRSSWEDYDKSLISEGGGVWPRSAKSIKVPARAREVLGIDQERLTPTELIRQLLKAPVDLVYNGGIGTYVRGSNESDAAVGDRANDPIRITGAELRCKVFGEGGNLGATQLGRIEFALAGGMVNTDAIDNSGGVDCSDHEVNIKILLDAAVVDGELTGKQRDKLLADMTEEVATLVLRDNYQQTQNLSLTRARGVALLDEQGRFMRRLGNEGRLNRKLEFLPFDEDIAERRSAGRGLTSPELAVLLAYSKIELFDQLLETHLPEDAYISTALVRYFPVPLRERFAEDIQKHPLKREIITTHVVNSMVNRTGATFVSRLREETSAAPDDIVRAYIATRDVFDLPFLWRDIEALDNQIPAELQLSMALEGQRLIQRGTQWFLRRRQHLEDIGAAQQRFGEAARWLSAELAAVVAPRYRAELEENIAGLVDKAVPEALAQRIAGLDETYSALDLVDIAADSGRSLELAARVYFALGGHFDLHWMAQQISNLPAESHWQALARAALRDDLSTQARNLAQAVLCEQCEDGDPYALIADWEATRPAQVARCRQILEDLRTARGIDIAMMSVAMRELRTLT